MKILAIGDLVGENGLAKLKKDLDNIQEAENIDFTIVNAENVAGGMGITTKIFQELKNMDIDVLTMGNHTWGKKDIFSFIDDPMLVRPANYSKGVPGHGYTILTKNSKTICVINILRKVSADIFIVDFHAEASAEKIAMGYFLDGRVNAVYGTHTHVQTADETILDKGTAYITDIGMTGPRKSVIGMDVDASLKRFVTSLPERYKLATGDCKLNGVVFEINDENCRTEKVYRINI